MTGMKRAALYRALLLFCAAFLVAEVAYEVAEHWRDGQSRSYLDMIHLLFELLSAVFLVVAFSISSRYQAALKRFGDREHQALVALRSRFDDEITTRFDAWGLSAAECDVALLSFRGLRIAEIAEARGTRAGTVKAQLSSVLHKAGVGTKAELMAVFMDLFLDISSEDGVVEPWQDPVEPSRQIDRAPRELVQEL